MNVRLYLKRKSPTILTYMGAVGVCLTAVLTAKATPKALLLIEEAKRENSQVSKVDTIFIATPAYIPSIIAGVSTIACILGANVLNRKQQASLVSAYMMLDRYHKEYREMLIELYGKETDEVIKGEICRTHCNYHQINSDVPDGKIVFYEPISGETLVRYEKEIMDAEYHLNRNFILKGGVSLNEFYEFLGLPQTEYGETVGWSMSEGYCWIDFEHTLTKDENGNEVYSIDTFFSPEVFDE